MLLLVPFLLMFSVVLIGRYVGPVANGVPSSTYCVLSFDAEEDWDPNGGMYLDSYKYVTSGMLPRLVRELSQRDIRATFYCTPNLAKSHPEILQLMERMGHEVGVHLHTHQIWDNVVYPHDAIDSETLANRGYGELYSMVRQAKQAVEDAVGHRVYSFRSGQWSCDVGVEEACANSEFESISNHRSTCLLPSGLWQMETSHGPDVLRASYIVGPLFATSERSAPRLIPLFSHPMVLYDYGRDTPNKLALKHFLADVDGVQRHYPTVQFLTTREAVSHLRYSPPSMFLMLGVSGFCIIIILFGLYLANARSERESRESVEMTNE